LIERSVALKIAPRGLKRAETELHAPPAERRRSTRCPAEIGTTNRADHLDTLAFLCPRDAGSEAPSRHRSQRDPRRHDSSRSRSRKTRANSGKDKAAQGYWPVSDRSGRFWNGQWPVLLTPIVWEFQEQHWRPGRLPD